MIVYEGEKDMKKEYVTPMMVGERFAPNEYVAACGDSGTTYLFTCDAGGGESGTVYLETNDQKGLQKNEDKYLSGYHACGTKHKADSTDAFLEGYYVTKKWQWEGWKPVEIETITPVIVWRGPKGDNTHCTTNLNMDTWETTKS